MGFVLVTRPFHPLSGQRLEVLFAKRRDDGVVFVCGGGAYGSITLPRAWTDRGEPPLAHRLSAEGLAALDTLVRSLPAACRTATSPPCLARRASWAWRS